MNIVEPAVDLTQRSLDVLALPSLPSLTELQLPELSLPDLPLLLDNVRTAAQGAANGLLDRVGQAGDQLVGGLRAQLPEDALSVLDKVQETAVAAAGPTGLFLKSGTLQVGEW